jgi:hypothetical protein
MNLLNREPETGGKEDFIRHNIGVYNSVIFALQQDIHIIHQR